MRTVLKIGISMILAMIIPVSLTLSHAASMELKSPAFLNGEMIPVKYSGFGDDVSPRLEWVNVPDGTRSFALIMDDPDAPLGTWIHWVIYNIPGTSRGLAENRKKTFSLPDGSLQGLNSFRWPGYAGPYPPAGPAHRYVFTLYALDTELALSAGATKGAVIKALQGHILADSTLTGLFERGEEGR